MNYYGRFFRSKLSPLLQRINTYLMRWAGRKYKRLRSYKRFKAWWFGIIDRDPELFAHWRWVRTFAGSRGEERSDGRLSRSVLREPGGEIPPGYPTSGEALPTACRGPGRSVEGEQGITNDQ